MVRRVLVLLLIALATAVGVTSPANAARSTTAVVSGRLITQDGAPIAGAMVSIGGTNYSGFEAQGTTDGTGRFALSVGRPSARYKTVVFITFGKQKIDFFGEVTSKPVTNLGDFVLTNRPLVRGTFTGTVYEVDFLNRAGHVVFSQYLPKGAHSFEFSWDKPGTYTIRLSNLTSNSWTYLGNTAAFEKAHYVSLTARSHRTLKFMNAATGSASGLVTSVRVPAKGKTASLLLVRQGGSDVDSIVTTPSRREFSTTGIPAGTYRVTTWESTRSRANTTGATRFKITAGKTTSLGTFVLPTAYFSKMWGDF